MTSEKSGKKRRAEESESDSDSSADEQDFEAFHKRMNANVGVGQESGER